VHAKASMAPEGIGPCVDGRKSGLMAGIGVQGVHFLVVGVIRWQRCGRCGVTGVIETHGDGMRSRGKSGGRG
jgi:hypothetical protein